VKSFKCLNKDKLYRLTLDEEQRQCLEDLLHNIPWEEKTEIQLRLYNEIKETEKDV
jgi:hypothetical protein